MRREPVDVAGGIIVIEHLAIDGGRPVRRDFLPYARHHITSEDREAVMSALDSDWLTTGPTVVRFEEALAEYCGVSDAAVVSSGTAALHLVALASGVRQGRDVMTPALTFVATANAALFCGARTHFVDIDAATLNVDPENVAARLTSEIAVVMPVHYAGQPCRMDEIRDAIAGTGAVVIEDAAHALGAIYRGRPVGSLGQAAVFSFHPAKHVTTFEGGAVVTNDRGLADEVRRLRNHSINQDLHVRSKRGGWEYEISQLGFNYRLSDVACALGISQLKRMDEKLRVRRDLAALYIDKLQAVAKVAVPAVTSEVEHAWHLFPILLDPELDRSWAFRAMRAENIGVNVHYIPVNRLALHSSDPAETPNTADAYKRLLTLPLFETMSERDIDDVVSALGKVTATRRPAVFSG